jgi:hypothetical protein
LIHLFDVNTIPQSGKIEFDFIVTEALALQPLNVNDFRHFNILRDKDVLEVNLHMMRSRRIWFMLIVLLGFYCLFL